jgi:small subunit ribosomal protein S13
MVFNGAIKNSAYLSEQYQHIVRILGNDILGDKKMIIGLTQIKGVGYMFANSILQKLNINPNDDMGNLTSEQATSIENVIKDPKSAEIPTWFWNRQKDVETGEDKHLVTSDFAFNVRNDIEREKDVFSWRGYRHMYGLKVRGQRTRCTGRKGGAVGVAKGGRVAPGKPGAPAAAGVEGTATEGAEAGATTEGATAEKKEAPAAEKKETPKSEKK